MIRKILFGVLFHSFLLSSILAQIQVSQNQRFLMTKDKQPFFWLGDTDWELFHRLTREEAEEFLEVRRQQGFNVIQAVALAEFNGIREANRYGDLPLVNEDPTKLAITQGKNPSSKDEYDYWDHVDFIIHRAAEKGMYIGLLPTWGDKVTQAWGDGPTIFNAENAEVYGAILAKRYAKQWNIIWILGGDRPAIYKAKHNGMEQDDRPIWRAMAKGIEEVLGKNAFITYHPSGGSYSTTSYIHNEAWLDMNAFQSGHGSREAAAWNWVTRDLAMQPQKPTLDMEPCYEDHPVNPWDGKWTPQRGYFKAYDVRARIYRGGADVIRVRMRRDEVVELLDFVTLQSFEDDFAFARITSIDKNGLTPGRQNQSRIAFDRANIKHNDFQFAGRFWRLGTPPRQSPLDECKRARAQQQHEHRNHTSASAS